MNETTHRFLRAIVERVPNGRIAELRLFPAIRQGGVESAVAVVAVEQPEIPLAAADDEVASGDGTADGFVAHDDGSPDVADAAEVEVLGSDESATVEDSDESPYRTDDTGSTVDADALVVRVETDIVVIDDVVTELADLTAGEAVADALDVEVTRVVAAPFTVHAEAVLALGPDESRDEDDTDGERETDVTLTVEPGAAARAPHGAAASDDLLGEPEQRRTTPSDVEVVLPADAGAAADAGSPEPVESIALGDILALPGREVPAEDAQKAEDDLHKRYAILTARYRLVLKGPDRGKWEVDIVHEADAPLATVERVARGVARRSGDEADPEHFSGEALRHAIERPSWATSA